MTARRYHILVLLFIMLAGLTACSGNTKAADSRLSVKVTIPPQAFFVEKIGGDRVAVEIILPAGKDPHFFELSTRSVSEILDSDVYFLVGIPQEKTLLDILKQSSRTLQVVDMSQHIQRRLPDEPFFTGFADSGSTDHHDADQEDVHIWMSPRLVKQQAETICAALAEKDPGSRAYYRERLDRFTAELDELDRKIREMLAGVTERTLLVYHPAFGYFADEYGFTQVPVEIEGKEPASRGLSMLIDMATSRHINKLFIDPLVVRRKALIIASSINAEIVEIDPLARQWDAMMLEFAGKINDHRKNQ